MVDYVRNQPEVDYVEPNLKMDLAEMETKCTVQKLTSDGTWGLERTTMKDWKPKQEYIYDADKGKH